MRNPLTARQEAKLNSYRTTEQHVDGNITIIAAIPAFSATYNTIKANIALFVEAAEEKAASLTGIAAGKSAARTALIKKTGIIAGVIHSYAVEIGDDTLREEMNFTPSDLKRTRDDELAPLARMVHDRATTHRAALADYNITPEKLTDLQTAIDTYAAEVPKPRTAIGNRKTTNINVNNVIRDTDKIFETRFDKQIASLVDDHPDFVTTYFTTREFVSPPTTTTQLKGIITDKSDGTPVKNAAITVTPVNPVDENASPFTTATDANGAYIIKPIPNGNYTITVTANGYQTSEQSDLRLIQGKINHFDIKLVK